MLDRIFCWIEKEMDFVVRLAVCGQLKRHRLATGGKMGAYSLFEIVTLFLHVLVELKFFRGSLTFGGKRCSQVYAANDRYKPTCNSLLTFPCLFSHVRMRISLCLSLSLSFSKSVKYIRDCISLYVCVCVCVCVWVWFWKCFNIWMIVSLLMRMSLAHPHSLSIYISIYERICV